MLIALLILGVVVLTGTFFWWQYASVREQTEDAFVDGHITNISSRVAGTVNGVKSQENQRGKVGESLKELEPKGYGGGVEQSGAGGEKGQHEANAARAKIGQSSLSA